MVDATVAPVLWRLSHYEVELASAPIIKYANHVFSRPAFRDSLSELEQEMRIP